MDMRKILLVFMGLVLSLLFLTTTGHAGYVVTQLTDNDYQDWSPEIKGRNLARPRFQLNLIKNLVYLQAVPGNSASLVLLKTYTYENIKSTFNTDPCHHHTLLLIGESSYGP